MKAKQLTKETILSVDVVDRGFPQFRVGDSIEVSQIVTEGAKERIQIFGGDVIAQNRNGIATTFTVRRIGAGGVGVERIYPYYSPIIDSIRVVKRGKVRRAKLFYLRDRVGRSARVQERILTKEQKMQRAAKENAATK